MVITTCRLKRHGTGLWFHVNLCILQVGVENMHKDSKYVLFLDDDVRLHPGSIGALTSEMEKNPEVHLL